MLIHQAGSDNRREQTTATAAEIIQHGGFTYTRRFAVFDSTTHPTSDFVPQLDVLSQKEYLRNAFEIGFPLLMRVQSLEIPEGLKNALTNTLIWCIGKIKKTFTDEVVSAWKFANQNRTWLNCFRAVRVTAVTTASWIAG